MNSLKIELFSSLKTNDVRKISDLDQKWIKHHWRDGQWKEELEKTSSGLSALFLAKEEAKEQEQSEVMGFSLFALNPWIQQAHLLKIAVKPEFRGLGVAPQLMRSNMNWLRERKMNEIYLEVAVNNMRAIGFYKKLGFTGLCVKKAFYTDGADALAMLLTL